MTGNDWSQVCCELLIEDNQSEAYNQNKNFTERRGGMLKHTILKLFHYGNEDPLKFWRYSLENFSLVRD